MKLFFLTVFTCLSLSLLAQDRPEFNVFAGPQTSFASYAVEGIKQETTNKFGFHIGAGMKIPFENRLYFAPAIYYTMKGYKVKYTRGAYPPDMSATDNNTTFHNFETAFLLQYDFSGKPDHAYFKIGPSIDFQVFGNEKFNTPTGAVDRKIPFGYDKYGHYSTNMILQLGYEMKSGFFFSGQYTHGLSSINNADGGPRIRHRVAGVSIGKKIFTK